MSSSAETSLDVSEIVRDVSHSTRCARSGQAFGMAAGKWMQQPALSHSRTGHVAARHDGSAKGLLV